MTRTIGPQPFIEIQGRPECANTAASWERRGFLLAEASVEEWPFMDWDKAARAAHCFTIAAALSASQPAPAAACGGEKGAGR